MKDHNLYQTWVASASGTTSASVSRTGVAGEAMIVTDLSAGGDLAAYVKVESPPGTIIWRGSSPVGGLDKSFEPGVIRGPSGSDVLARISVGSASCQVSVGGYIVKETT